MAGVAGFEPTHAGVKVPCLTAWLHPFIWDFLPLWQGQKDLNPRMLESESSALPLGDAPLIFGSTLTAPCF